MTPTKFLIGQVLIVLAIVVLATWMATQYAANALGYQDALGPAWFHVGGTRVYLPWRLYQWWIAYEGYAPRVFSTAGLIAIAGGVFGMVVSIIGSLWRARQAKNVTTYGSSRWASIKDTEDAHLFANRGVMLGLKDRRYLRHDGPEHVMCFAPTRSGKGVGLVIPTLLSWTDSAVIHDIKGENWQLTAGWRSKFSHVILFNPTDPASSKFNPLMEVRQGRNEVRDVQNIADILVDPEGSLEKRNHWEKTSHALLVGVILHVLYAEKNKTLSGVASFLSNPDLSFQKTLRLMLKSNHLGDGEVHKVHPVVAEAARELLNKSDNERSGVLSTAMSFLGLYRDPTVANATSRCDWRITDLVMAARPVSLYLVVPPSDISRTKPLIRLILNQIGRRLTEKLEFGEGKDERHKLLLMLDEFPALGRLDFFESALAFMAGYGLRAFLIAQSLNQIEKAYGPNNSILDNCHVRVAFATNDERTAKRISDGLGSMTELRAQKNYAGHRLAPWLSHVMVSRQETPRQLLTPGEIMQLPNEEEILMVSGHMPIKAQKIKYYEDLNFSGRRLDPPECVIGGDVDCPLKQADDWTGRTIASLDHGHDSATNFADDSADDEGGLKRHPALPENEQVKDVLQRALDPFVIVDNDLDNPPATKNFDGAKQLGDVQKAHGINQGFADNGDDGLPDF